MAVIDSVANATTKAQNLRTARYHARRCLAADPLLPKEGRRVRACGARAHKGQMYVGVRAKVSAGSVEAAGYAGVQTCGSVWVCPVCSAKIMSARTADNQKAIENWASAGGTVAFFTFTMRHNKSQRLKFLWDSLSTAWNAVTSGREHQEEKSQYGVTVPYVIKSGAKKGETVQRARLPHVRVVEVTDGQNGWHVHTHVMIFLPGTATHSDAQALYNSMWKRWNTGLESCGIYGNLDVNEIRFLTAEKALASAAELAAYGNKNTYGEKLAMEVGRSDLKKGRKGSLTAFEMLRGIVAGDFEDPDSISDRFYEYVSASKGRRQTTWGVQSREILGLTTDDLTDEELAALEIGTKRDEVARLTREDYRRLSRMPRALSHVLNLLESSSDVNHGVYLAWVYLHELGVHLLPPAPDVEINQEETPQEFLFSA